jgi:hypothetical protein
MQPAFERTSASEDYWQNIESSGALDLMALVAPLQGVGERQIGSTGSRLPLAVLGWENHRREKRHDP